MSNEGNEIKYEAKAFAVSDLEKIIEAMKDQRPPTMEQRYEEATRGIRKEIDEFVKNNAPKSNQDGI